jgi:hypothetical protein
MPPMICDWGRKWGALWIWYAYQNGENWLYRCKYPQDIKHGI